MSEPICNECRYWNHLEDGWGVCLRTEVDERQQPTDGATNAYVYGPGVDEDCALMTAATFGCNQFERGAS